MLGYMTKLCGDVLGHTTTLSCTVWMGRCKLKSVLKAPGVNA